MADKRISSSWKRKKKVNGRGNFPEKVYPALCLWMISLEGGNLSFTVTLISAVRVGVGLLRENDCGMLLLFARVLCHIFLHLNNTFSSLATLLLVLSRQSDFAILPFSC